jgi:hypothetical protein
VDFVPPATVVAELMPPVPDFVFVWATVFPPTEVKLLFVAWELPPVPVITVVDDVPPLELEEPPAPLLESSLLEHAGNATTIAAQKRNDLYIFEHL